MSIDTEYWTNNLLHLGNRM